MKTTKNNLGRNLLIILFAAQISVLNIGCEFLEGNQTNIENAVENDSVTETNEDTESTPVAESENPEQIETHEKLDKISNHEWINQMNNLVIFGKPKKEGDIYTGEYIVYYDEFSDIFKYEILEDGLWKIIGIKKLYKDGTEQPYVHESNYNLQMDEEGKTLVLKNHEATYVLRRK